MRTWQNIPKTFQETNIDETSRVNYMEIPAQHILKYGTVSESWMDIIRYLSQA